MNWQEKIYSYPLPTRYLVGPVKGDPLVVLLHGYQDNAQSMLRRLGWPELNLPFQWLAPNAPFPVPVWTASGFKEAYSWYFRDTDRKLVYVRPATTAERMVQWMKDTGVEHRPVVLFGFSQGGYFAPYVAKLLPNVRGIVALGCGYSEEGYADLKPLPVWGIHGQADERIPLDQAQREHAQVLARGFSGGFDVVPGLTHKVEASTEPLIRERIQRCFGEK